MNSKQLISIIKELKTYKTSIEDKNTILERRIQERLDQSLKDYYNVLSKAFDKLSEYDETHDLRLIKRFK